MSADDPFAEYDSGDGNEGAYPHPSAAEVALWDAEFHAAHQEAGTELSAHNCVTCRRSNAGQALLRECNCSLCVEHRSF